LFGGARPRRYGVPRYNFEIGIIAVPREQLGLTQRSQPFP
jgi:hypothetical protein